MEIIYEDNHLLVVNKPAGLLTQPSGTDQDSLENQAKQWLKVKYAKPGNVFLTAVHRLDKPASGIVVLAKTSKALSRLNESMREKETLKIYWARIENRLPSAEGILENYLKHGDFQAEVVMNTHPEGKLARLRYKLVKDDLVEIELETGRYHQIRAQLSAIGCPILGDTRYGSKSSLPGGVIALHHKSLTIPHPITQEPLIFEANLPILFTR